MLGGQWRRGGPAGGFLPSLCPLPPAARFLRCCCLPGRPERPGYPLSMGAQKGADLVRRVETPQGLCRLGGDLIPPYLEQLAIDIAAAVRAARESVQPAALAYTAGRCPLAGNRDFWDESSQQFVCGLDPAGPADDTVLVVRASDTAG